jgi:hypothetical protein
MAETVLQQHPHVESALLLALQQQRAAGVGRAPEGESLARINAAIEQISEIVFRQPPYEVRGVGDTRAGVPHADSLTIAATASFSSVESAGQCFGRVAAGM